MGERLSRVNHTEQAMPPSSVGHVNHIEQAMPPSHIGFSRQGVMQESRLSRHRVFNVAKRAGSAAIAF